MIKIAPYLRYVEATEEPLSGDVFFIEGDRNIYVFDVGANEDAARAIAECEKDVVVILSHFHPDHIGNIDRVEYKELYVGKKTYDKVHKGTIVSDKLTIEDGVKIEILHCPSPHAKGSLIVTVNNEYTLLGDLYYTRKAGQDEVARYMIHILKGLDTKFFVPSHQKAECVFPKDEFIEELKGVFCGNGVTI